MCQPLHVLKQAEEHQLNRCPSAARECDTDGEPGLDAREIANLIQSLGYLPDMACSWEIGGWRCAVFLVVGGGFKRVLKGE